MIGRSDELQLVAAVDGEGDGLDALEGDDDHLVLVDTLDVALDTGEVALDEADFTTLELLYFVRAEEEDPVLALGLATGIDETLHLAEGDDGVAGGLEASGGELQGGARPVVHLHPADALIVGLDEDEIVDGGLLTGDDLLADPLVSDAHGQEGFEALFVEHLLDIQLALIGHEKGIPVVAETRVIVGQ